MPGELSKHCAPNPRDARRVCCAEAAVCQRLAEYRHAVCSKRGFARWLLLAVALSGCQPPAPAVDEERLARRVADLLAERFAEEGTCRPRSGSGSEQAENDDPADDSQADPQAAQQAALNAMRDQLGRLVQQAQLAIPEPALPTVELPADRRATTSGTGDHARTCIPLPADTPALGPEQPAVTIVAFLDPECPFCARFYPRLLRAQRAYAQDVRLAVALQPLVFHHSAPRASMALREVFAQRQSAGFFEFFSRVYADTRDLSLSTLAGYAEELNVDSARLREAIADGRHANAVATTVALATSANSTGTPTLFVNGRRLIGAVSDETLGGVLFEELERARRLRRTTPAARLQATLCRADSSSAAAQPAHPRPLPTGDAQ